MATPPFVPTKVKITPAVLRRMLAVNQFELPTDIDVVFFGIRGAVPEKNVYDSKFQFTAEANIITTQVNFTNFRCTIGQWWVKENKIGLFLGSTVPGKGNIDKSLSTAMRVNMMLTGYYNDYKKGVHSPANKSSWHDAFKQRGDRPVRRTHEDITFDMDDPIDYGNQGDNIHSAFTEDQTKAPSASQGCQIIVGLPKRINVVGSKETSAWGIFRSKAYTAKQETFPYLLLEGKDFVNYGTTVTPTSARLRFGSTGKAMIDLQAALIKTVNKDLKPTGIFDVDTMKAVVKFQLDNKLGTDGIVGPTTAGKLGVTLLTV